MAWRGEADMHDTGMKSIRKIRSAGVAAIVITACASEPPRDAPAAPPADTAQPAVWVDSAGVLEPDVDPASVSALDRFIASGPRIHARSRDEFDSVLGARDSTHAEAVRNRHVPQQTDSLITVHYDDVTATVYAVTGGRDILNSITIRDNRWLRDGPVRIGTAWSDVVAQWGEPASTDGDSRHFECRQCVVSESVVLEVRDGRVAAIRFEHYVD